MGDARSGWFAVPTASLFITACNGPRQISHSGRGAYEASVAAFRDGFAVAWYDTRDGNAEIYARLLNAEGRPQGPEHRLTHDADESYEASIEEVQDNLAIAWYEKSASGRLRARLGIWSRNLEQVWTTTISAVERNGRNPVVIATGTELFCAWIEESTREDAEIWAGWWHLDGRLLSPARRLASAGRTTWNLNAAFDGDGRAWVLFDAKVGTRREELFVARADKSTSEVVRLTADDGYPSKYPDLVFGKDAAGLTWFDERDGNQEVYLFIAPAKELKEGFEPTARRVTNTPGESIGAYVGWNGRGFGLAWCDDSGGQDEVYFQPFDAKGAPAGEPRRLTRNATQSLIPAIEPWNSGFALAWNEYTPAGEAHQSRGKSEIVFLHVR